MTDVRSLDAFGELCFHVLASVPLAGPGSSYAPEYLAWARAHELFDDDAKDDGELIASCSRPALLHAWPRLHRDLAAFARTCRNALTDLRSSDVDEAPTLAAILGAGDPTLEIMHARLGLALPQWTRVHADVIAPALASARDRLAPMFATAAALVPSFAGRRVDLSWVLGPRGRAHPERLIVGAPATWHDGSDGECVVLALHEHAVRDLAHGEWLDVEWFALRRVSRWLADGSLAQAHARWIARLDLRALLEAARDRGWLDPATAQRIEVDLVARPTLLAALDQSTTGR